MAETKTHRLRGQQMRVKILDAAKEQFAAHGYVGASLNTIAKAAGITQPGLLHHYGSKEELFREVLREQRENDTDMLAEAEQEGLRGIGAFVDRVRTLPDYLDIARLYHVLVGESVLDGVPMGHYVRERYHNITTGLTAGLRAGHTDGTVREDADIDAIVGILIGASDGLRTQLLLNPEFDYKAGIELLARLVTGYVTPEDGSRSEQ